MKKCAVLFCLAIVCLSCAFSYAQSRRVPPTAENGKANKRDAKPATSLGKRAADKRMLKSKSHPFILFG